MFNIIGHKKKANKTMMRYHFTVISMTIILKKKKKKITSFGRNVEKLEPYAIEL